MRWWNRVVSLRPLAAYQRMVDLRPDLQSYSRVAYMRWLKGDLDGAIEVARLAVSAASPLDPESASWSLTRLGLYYFQAGSLARRQGGLRLGAELLSPTILLRCCYRADVARRMVYTAEAIAPSSAQQRKIRCRNFSGRWRTHSAPQAAMTKPRMSKRP